MFQKILNGISQPVKVLLTVVHMDGYPCPHLAHEDLHPAVDAIFLQEILHEWYTGAPVGPVDVRLRDVVLRTQDHVKTGRPHARWVAHDFRAPGFAQHICGPVGQIGVVFHDGFLYEGAE